MKAKKFYLLLSFDADSDAKSIIDKKVLSYLAKNKEHYSAVVILSYICKYVP
jgi:hypothetical protein